VPLKLHPPRPRNPCWVIRGSYLHIKRLHQSTGTADEKIAKRILTKIKREIERGAYADPAAPTFAGAVISYIQAGGETRFLGRLNEHFRNTPLSEITQAKVDEAAIRLYPDASPATRNRQVYSPVSAVLRHAGIKIGLNRPKGGRGVARTTWLQPEQAFALLAAAEALQPRFGALCTFLLYTGCRLSEALALQWTDLDLANATAYVQMTKNGEPRTVFLPPNVVSTMANLNAGKSVFRFAKAGALYELFNEAVEKAGLNLPERVAFHLLRHTFGAWMRRYGGLDTSGLVGTGAWKSRQAAAVYEHVEVSEEAKKAALLPVAGGGKVGG
jgi:integrase